MERLKFNIEEKNWMVQSIQKTVNVFGTSLDLICRSIERDSNKVSVGDKVQIGGQEFQIVSTNIIFKGEHLDAESLGLLVLPPGEVEAWKKRVDRS